MAKAELPITVKLTDGARSFGMPPGEFRDLLVRHDIPVMRPSVRRERILEDHLHQLRAKISGPAVRA
jgi:hypothetical protein